MTIFETFADTQKMIDNLEKIYTVVPVLAIFTIVSNLIVVVSSGLLFKKGYEPRCTYLLLGNISLADLITSCAIIAGSLQDQKSHFGCTFRIGVYTVSAICSNLSVGALAKDRYLYIIHGLKYHRIVSPARVKLMIWGTWFISIVAGFLPLMLYGRESSSCWFTLVAPTNLIIGTTLIGFIPLFCIITFYCIILKKAIENVQRMKNSINLRPANGECATIDDLRIYVGKSRYIPTVSKKVENISAKVTAKCAFDNKNKSRVTKRVNKVNDETNTAYNQRKWKAIKVVMFTTTTHTFISLPYLITSCMYAFCDVENTPRECNDFLINITSPLGVLTFLSAFTNPIIYAWWHTSFRHGIKHIYDKHKRLYRVRTSARRGHNISGKVVEVTHL